MDNNRNNALCVTERCIIPHNSLCSNILAVQNKRENVLDLLNKQKWKAMGYECPPDAAP